jgi:hypothetical protein
MCNVLFGGGFYKMNLICLLAEARQGTVAEMLLTRMSGAYYNTGGGFCIDVAGKSMESLHFKELSSDEATDRWNELFDWVELHTPLTEEMCRQQEFAELNEAQALLDEIAASSQELRRNLTEIQEFYELGQTWKDHPSWQTEEGRECVRRSEQAWEMARAAYPEFNE